MPGIRVAQKSRRTVIHSNEESRKTIISGVANQMAVQSGNQLRLREGAVRVIVVKRKVLWDQAYGLLRQSI